MRGPIFFLAEAEFQKSVLTFHQGRIRILRPRGKFHQGTAKRDNGAKISYVKLLISLSNCAQFWDLLNGSFPISLRPPDLLFCGPRSELSAVSELTFN